MQIQEKKEVRKIVYDRRNAAKRESIEEGSRKIFANVKKYLNFDETIQMYLYYSYQNEVDTVEFLKDCLKMGIRVALPRVNPNTMEMEFFYIESLDDVVEGYKGIPEPKESCMPEDEKSNHKILIMPGVAFDLEHNRTGYGKGFYDKYLHTHRKKFEKRIAVAFEFQIFEAIAHDENDIAPEIIITEERIF